MISPSESNAQVGLFGLQKAPVTKPAHKPPNNKFAHPSIAYELNPRNMGIVKLGIMPTIVVQNNSLFLEHEELHLLF